jgi:hypothetical protein
VRAGAALSYTDNDDGTVTDHNTGLMWEKKDDSGGIHDKDNSCTLFFGYWSSTTFRDYPFSAWYVFFDAGYTFGNNKGGSFAVRAVRGGL